MWFILLFCLLVSLSGSKGSDYTQKIEMERRQRILEYHQTKENAEELGMKVPHFQNKRDEIMWKMNLAKKTLRKAREIEDLARKAAKHFGYYDGNRQKHVEIAQLLGKADDTVMSAGEKMGFEFEKY